MLGTLIQEKFANPTKNVSDKDFFPFQAGFWQKKPKGFLIIKLPCAQFVKQTCYYYANCLYGRGASKYCPEKLKPKKTLSEEGGGRREKKTYSAKLAVGTKRNFPSKKSFLRICVHDESAWPWPEKKKTLEKFYRQEPQFTILCTLRLLFPSPLPPIFFFKRDIFGKGVKQRSHPIFPPPLRPHAYPYWNGDFPLFFETYPRFPDFFLTLDFIASLFFFFPLSLHPKE